VPPVEEDVLGAGLAHPGHGRLGHDVPWRQFGERMPAGHEPGAGRVDEVGALPSHRLGDQRLPAPRPRTQPQHGRMELHELQVGHRGAGPQRQRHPVARGHLGVGGGGEDLPEPAGGQHDGGGPRRAHPVALPFAHDVQGHAGGPAGVVDEQVEDEGVFDDLDLRRLLQRREQRPADLGPGGVPAGVRDAALEMPALAGQRDVAVGAHIEVGAGRDEPADGRRPLRDEGPHGRVRAQPDPGGEGVGEMLGGAVIGGQRRRDAALRPPGGAVVEQRLGDEQHPSVRPRPQRRDKPRDARPHDDDVGVPGPPGRRSGEPPSQRSGRSAE
jgi:hypothetical protein